MEQRKLIRLGNSSFAIALPKQWVTNSGLQKGDKIFLEQNGNGEIIVSPEFKKQKNNKKIILTLDGKNESKLRREFTSAYINGNHLFQFEGRLNPEKKKIIRRIVSEYIGCELLEENGKLIAKDFFNLEDIKINHFIKRIENNLREMFDSIIDYFENRKLGISEIEEIDNIDRDINRFYFLNSRIMLMGLNSPSLINKLKISPTSLFNNWWLSFHLEHTGDNLKSIAKTLKREKLNQKDKEALSALFKEMKEKYRQVLEIFYTNNREKAQEIMEGGKKLWEICKKLTKNKHNAVALIGEKCKNIENSSYQIAKMVSNMESEDGN